MHTDALIQCGGPPTGEQGPVREDIAAVMHTDASTQCGGPPTGEQGPA